MIVLMTSKHCGTHSFISIRQSNFRLQQPGQNPISDSTNFLWNSPSLGKITDATPGIIKSQLFYHLKEKNRVKLIYFFLV